MIHMPRCRYPQCRMQQLLRVIGNAVVAGIQDKLDGLDVWDAPFDEVAAELISGIGICEQWCETSSELTSLWKENAESRIWQGPTYADEFVSNLSCRLKAVLDLRKTCMELDRLLGGEFSSGPEIGAHALSRHFTGIKPFVSTRATDPTWCTL